MGAKPALLLYGLFPNSRQSRRFAGPRFLNGIRQLEVDIATLSVDVATPAGGRLPAVRGGQLCSVSTWSLSVMASALDRDPVTVTPASMAVYAIASFISDIFTAAVCRAMLC